MMGTWMLETCREEKYIYIKQNCAPSWTYLQGSRYRIYHSSSCHASGWVMGLDFDPGNNVIQSEVLNFE